jgi:hypothetical protein
MLISVTLNGVISKQLTLFLTLIGVTPNSETQTPVAERYDTEAVFCRWTLPLRCDHQGSGNCREVVAIAISIMRNSAQIRKDELIAPA